MPTAVEFSFKALPIVKQGVLSILSGNRRTLGLDILDAKSIGQ